MTIECVDIQDLDCTRLRLGQTEKHSWAYKDHNTQVMKSSSTLHCKLLYLFENDHDEYSRKYMLHKLPTELYESIMDYVLEPSKFGLLLKNNGLCAGTIQIWSFIKKCTNQWNAKIKDTVSRNELPRCKYEPTRRVSSKFIRNI